jgi:hypothetical protein
MDDIDSGFDQIAELAAANSKIVAVLGARAMVLGKFHDTVVPYLTTSQRIAITRSFREGVEDAMALMDDVALSAEYHSALLEITNGILTVLAQDSPAGQ